MTTTQFAQIIGLLILLLFSAFFAGSETALFSLSRIRVRNLMDNGVPKANLIFQFLNDPGRLLSTLLIGNNLVNIVSSSLATVLFISLLGQAYGVPIAMLVMTILVLIVGEIVPKTYANHFSEKWALRAVGPIKTIMSILSPVISVFTWVTNFIMRLSGSTNKRTSLVTEDELRTVINLGQKEGVIEAEERYMLTSVLEFTDTIVREVMVPRVDMFALSVSTSLQEAARVVVEQKYSRIPLYEGTTDHIVGIVHVKDLLAGLLTDGVWNLAEVMREVIFVPEAIPIGQLLQVMQKERVSMAIVLDEYGATSGLVTIEDIVEEIVGDITDEYDDGDLAMQVIDDKVLLLDGSFPVSEINDELGTNLPEECVDTIGGFMFFNIGRIPKVGDRVEYHGWDFVVEEMEGRRVSKVKVCKQS